MADIRLKSGTKAQLPSLAVDEPGFCTDTGELYIGSSGGNKKIGPLSYAQETATSSDNTTSTSYDDIVDMDHTIAEAGVYLVLLNMCGCNSQKGETMNWILTVDTGGGDTEEAHTERELSYNSSGAATLDVNPTLSTQMIKTLAVNDVVKGKFKTTGGTFTVGNRSLILMRIA